MTDELLPFIRCQRVCEQVQAELYSPNGTLRKDKAINWERCVALMEEANQMAYWSQTDDALQEPLKALNERPPIAPTHASRDSFQVVRR